MDASRFTDTKTGQLVKIAIPTGNDWAFVPDPLPPVNWTFPHRLWPLLAEACEKLARLDERGKTIGNPDLLLEPLQSREALRSSSLEGTYATPKELLLYEIGAAADPKAAEQKSDKRDEAREVANYMRALKHGHTRLKTGSLPLSKRLLTEMHGILMDGVRGSEKGSGEFRKRQVHIGSDRRYVAPPPGDHMERCLDQFETFINIDYNVVHPLVLSYLVHYQFEAIHPFPDGNGRVGRLLLALTTYSWSSLFLPWLYMSAYFERYKDEYIANLFRISTHGDWDTWVEFCLRGTVEQALDAIARCDRLKQIRTKMHAVAKGLGLPHRLYIIIDCLFMSPVFTTSQVRQWGSSSKPTARDDVARLADAGLIEYLEGERPMIFYAPEIFNAAYSEDDQAAKPELDTDEPLEQLPPIPETFSD
jgi:Fic family protein